MSDFQQSKSILAKLLATENMTVEHQTVPTASFDTHNRILTLPVWEKTSHAVHNLLVGHEVGHALFTPDLVGSDIDLPQGYLNVVEDARIEKLMKRKYPGLSRTFHQGYVELDKEDFFEIEGEDLDKFEFIDRINLYFKMGNLTSKRQFIRFSKEEQELVDEIADIETFEQVIDVVRKLVDGKTFPKPQQSANGKPQQGDGQQGQIQGQGQSGQGSGDNGQGQSQGSSNQSQGDAENGGQNQQNQGSGQDESDGGKSGQNSSSNSSNSGGRNSGNFSSRTDNSWNKNQSKLSSLTGKKLVYITPPVMNVDNHIIPWKQVMSDMQKLYSDIASFHNNKKVAGSNHTYENFLIDQEASYMQYKADSRKTVSYLLKEFEMKKRATEYSRSSVATTGVLNTNKMHSYKWNDDVFKRITVVPKGKSHGLIMYVDWSGSMQGCLQGTIRQLYNLLQFCKKAHIPFDVYSFNDTNTARNYNKMTANYTPTDEVIINSDFLLCNLFSSRMNASTFDLQMRNIWKLSSLLDIDYTGLPNSVNSVYQKYQMGSTPLHESVFCAIPIFERFKRDHGLDIVNTVFLTDGESNTIQFYSKNMHGNVTSTNASWLKSIGGDVLCFKDTARKINYVDILNPPGGTFTTFLKYYREVTNSNVVGFRLISTYSARSFFNRYMIGDYPNWNAAQVEWAKSKSIISRSMGYNELYLLDLTTCNGSIESDELLPAPGSKDDLLQAFQNKMRNQNFNKIILSKFVDQIS